MTIKARKPQRRLHLGGAHDRRGDHRNSGSSWRFPLSPGYVKKSRTTEAVGHLKQEWAGSLSYYETDHMQAAARRCPSNSPAQRLVGPTPQSAAVRPVCGARAMPRLGALTSSCGWPSTSPFLIRTTTCPGTAAADTGTASQFTAYAKGDLNCNSTFGHGSFAVAV